MLIIEIKGLLIENIRALEDFLRRKCEDIHSDLRDMEPPVIELTNIKMMDSGGAVGSGWDNKILFEAKINVQEKMGQEGTPLKVLGDLLTVIAEDIHLTDVKFSYEEKQGGC